MLLGSFHCNTMLVTPVALEPMGINVILHAYRNHSQHVQENIIKQKWTSKFTILMNVPLLQIEFCYLGP